MARILSPFTSPFKPGILFDTKALQVAASNLSSKRLGSAVQAAKNFELHSICLANYHRARPAEACEEECKGSFLQLVQQGKRNGLESWWKNVFLRTCGRHTLRNVAAKTPAAYFIRTFLLFLDNLLQQQLTIRFNCQHPQIQRGIATVGNRALICRFAVEN